MKTFHYAAGHEAGSTMTVAELRQFLADYPDDMPVFASWEGCEGYINGADSAIESVHKGNKDEECLCLVFDVNRY